MTQAHLTVVPPAPPEPPVPQVEHLPCQLDLTYNWNYGCSREELRDLYKKAQRSQWLPDEVLPWDTSVDITAAQPPPELFPLHGTDIERRLTQQEQETLRVELTAWILSQFLHGEQGALLAASQLAATVPDMESKFYAATQVVDEARHIAVYERYIREKVGFSYPISPHLKSLLDLILKDSRWDLKLLGMQIMVEGLALASFGMIREYTSEPLLKRLIHYVMLDEARHVAYGVLSLKDFYADLGEAERREREDFVYEAAVLMRDRFLYQQVWEKAGLPLADCIEASRNNLGQQLFRQLLFSKVVPAVKRIGLLSPRQRERFAALGILQFESVEDPFAEFNEGASVTARVA
ncbi:MAG TPA: ferritin-like domain-containing protein [Polyangia bacterium]|jgi:hypothetical protein|nr:ferritin-like domain-containing protein [Polyangia bacterium]